MDFMYKHWSSLSTTAKSSVIGISGIAILAFLWSRKRKMGNRNAALRKPDYKEDVVYLYQFPSCRTIISISPFAMKLETWLRWRKIPYESTRGVRLWSKHGQIPFVEFNGEQIADSNIIIQFLQKRFHKDDNLNTEQKSISRAFAMMLENQTVFSYFYYRYVIDAAKFIGTWEFLGRIQRYIIGRFFPKTFIKKLDNHGIGKHSDEEIYDFGFQDLKAMSDYLGDKKYFFGDQMTTFDCYLFGHLCQILFIPVEYPHKKYLHEQCQNLVALTHRIKDDLWPDWDQICADNLQAK